MARTQAQLRSSRKQEILTEFTAMVAERGYDAVSIRDVAESMSISKGTVLHHYGSKDRLLEQVHSRYMDRRIEEAMLILADLDSPAEQLSGLIHQNFLAMHHDHAATVAFAREIVRFASDPLMSEVREKRRTYSRLMREVLARGMDRGDFRVEDPTMISLQIFGMLNWSWTWLRVEGNWTAEEVAGTFVRTIFSGLSKGDDLGLAAETDRVVRVVQSAIGRVSEAQSS